MKTIRKYKIVGFWAVLVVICAGCYSFKGISIPADVSTYYIPVFEIRTENAPPTVGQQFSERLKDKVRNESRLQWNEDEPDIEFTGAITGFRVNPVAPQPGETIALNRLEINVNINFINNKDEKKNWKQTFSFFNDFPANVNLLDVQTELVENIYEQLVEDIFNKAFTDW
jgi:hypothetical protein